MTNMLQTGSAAEKKKKYFDEVKKNGSKDQIKKNGTEEGSFL